MTRAPGRRFGCNQRGTAAIEFALLGPLHLALILSMMEAGLLFAKIALLDHAMGRASKFIYTGAAAGGTVTSADIEEFICDYVGIFMGECTGNITVELTPISDFNAPPDAAAVCRDTDVDLEPTVAFSGGAPNAIMYMRTCITTDVITPGLGLGLALTKTDGNKYQLVSAMAFANEPF